MAIRHGPYQGLIHAQRFPNSPCSKVSPTHTSVQTVSGNGLDSGSRLPRNPAATSVAKTAKEMRLAGSRSASGTLPIAQPRSRQMFQCSPAGEHQHDEARGDRERAADEIIARRQQQHIAPVGGVGEGGGGG